MNIKYFLAFTISVYTSSLFAMADSCTLINTPVESNIQESAKNEYLFKLANECYLIRTYEKLVTDLAPLGLKPKNLSEYHAIRYVGRNKYDYAMQINLPVEKIYQIKDEDYKLPVEQRSSIIWDNWNAGIQQLDAEVQRLQSSKEKFSLDDLKRVHRGFYTLSDEQGDHAHAPNIGNFKQPHPSDNYWWDFATNEEAHTALKTIQAINTKFKDLGFISNTENSEIFDVLRIKKAISRKDANQEVWAIYSGDTRANEKHVTNLLKMINQAIQKIKNNNHIILNGQLVTPMEFAVLVQQFYVDVHPFHEGNGRTSRFLQELLMTLFKLPHGASGDVSSFDVLTVQSEYYKMMFDKTLDLVERTQNCVGELQKNQTNPKSYRCNVLNKN